MTGSDAEPLAALEIKKIPGGQWRNTDYLASPLGPAEGPANPVPGPELSAGVVNSDGGASVEPPAAAAVDDPADMAAAAAAVGDPAAMAAAAAAVGNPASMAAAALEVRSTWDTSQQACLIAAVTECGEEPKMFQRIARRHGCDLGRRKAVSGC